MAAATASPVVGTAETHLSWVLSEEEVSVQRHKREVLGGQGNTPVEQVEPAVQVSSRTLVVVEEEEDLPVLWVREVTAPRVVQLGRRPAQLVAPEAPVVEAPVGLEQLVPKDRIRDFRV